MHRNRKRSEERTGFQEQAAYGPSYDLQTDFVMVYGIGPTMTERIRVWKEKGYVVHLMTGVAWGQYQDYLNGKIDGRSHWDEAQKNRHGETIIHGRSADVPYLVPTLSYAEFLTGRIRAAVDAGVEAIHLEEPEFWVEGGYSDAFRREWELYYNEPWSPPHATVDAQYRASKLKAYLYARCLDRLCGSLKEYAKVRYNRKLRFYVPTHSLINYTQWRIVSPESRLLDLPAIDGYIAQIWTGTARTPNVYRGVRKERTFETAYLEYGIMQELVRGTSRRMWFLHDPIEDDPKHTWEDYRQNYIRTLVASLLHPDVSRYEVAPWPRRIFEGRYPKEDGTGREGIPADYATVLLTVMHALGDMEQAEAGDAAGWKAGVLLADSAMFQRGGPGLSEGETSFKYDGTAGESAGGEQYRELLDWSPFYGLALPLVKQGLPVRPVQLDNVRRYPGYLDDYRLLVVSYEFMKPEYPDLHFALAQWVLEGGILVYVGDSSDPFHRVREWWNQGRKNYATPAAHLFECLGVGTSPAEGLHKVGRGVFAYLPVHPSACALKPHEADRLLAVAREAIALSGDPGLEWTPRNFFQLHRGPYVVAAVLDESVSEQPLVLGGIYVDLLDPGLAVRRQVVLLPGQQAFLYDVSRIIAPGSGTEPEAGDEHPRVTTGSPATRPQLIAASSSVEFAGRTERGGFRFTARGPERVPAVARFLCERKPNAIRIEHGSEAYELPVDWEPSSRTVLLRYDNKPEGVKLVLEIPTP